MEAGNTAWRYSVVQESNDMEISTGYITLWNWQKKGRKWMSQGGVKEDSWATGLWQRLWADKLMCGGGGGHRLRT